ncbi:MAG TPA: hypothetical protein VGN63_03630 [Flavisolibacter sp.]|nr:hypothetical protein [Flavisolibacter sp.]
MKMEHSHANRAGYPQFACRAIPLAPPKRPFRRLAMHALLPSLQQWLRFPWPWNCG